MHRGAELSCRRQSPAVSSRPRLFAAAILGLPLPRLIPSIFSPKFELPTMETRCHRLFIHVDISVPGDHLYPTKYPLALCTSMQRGMAG